MDIYVVDIETTGLDGLPENHVVEIALMRVNVLKQIVTQVYHTIIHYDTTKWDEDTRNAWIFKQGGLSIDDVQNAEKDLGTVTKEVQQILAGKFIAAFNNAFDLDKFLSKDPWKINEENNKTKTAPCLMLSAAEYLRPSGRKHKNRIYNLGYVKKNLVNNSTECIIINKNLEERINEFEAHRANYDAFYAACILLELYRRKQYRIVPQIYYAHSMKIYRKKQEKNELKIIRKIYPEANIINPAKYEKKWKGSTGKEIMKRCLDLLSKSDIVIFSALRYGDEYFVGKGVYVEVKFALELNMKVFFLSDKLEHNFSIDVYDDTDWELKFAKISLRK
ncbi:MAG: 3'-5' exonuclease [Candidatus Heimdallarchaeaceae archaeon]